MALFNEEKLNILSKFSNQKQEFQEEITIDNKYSINKIIAKCSDYNIYKAVDIEKTRWVTCYGKKVENNAIFSGKVKQSLKNHICPKILWEGQVKIHKSLLYFQIHQTYGPSLRSMFQATKSSPNPKELLHLLFQMIKLIQKLNSIKHVCGELDLDLIVFDPNPRKNQLFLLNCFKLKKKNQVSKPIHTKYCSRGAHLGRKITTKDDLESICYILIDIYIKGLFLSDKKCSQYEQIKLSLKIQQYAENLPRIFIEFYYYVISLNYNDEINFFYWKAYLTRVLSLEALSKPYGFILAKIDCKSHGRPDCNLIDKFQNPSNNFQITELEEQQELEKIARIKKLSKTFVKN